LNILKEEMNIETINKKKRGRIPKGNGPTQQNKKICRKCDSKYFKNSIRWKKLKNGKRIKKEYLIYNLVPSIHNPEFPANKHDVLCYKCYVKVKKKKKYISIYGQ
jgi:hypothetical protein